MFKELSRVLKPRPSHEVDRDFVDAQDVQVAAERLLIPSYRVMMMGRGLDDEVVTRIVCDVIYHRSFMKVCTKLTSSVKTVFAVSDGGDHPRVVAFSGGRTCKSAMTTSMMLRLLERRLSSSPLSPSPVAEADREDDPLWLVIDDEGALPDGGDIPGGKELLKHLRPYLYERSRLMFEECGARADDDDDRVFVYRREVADNARCGDRLRTVLKNAVDVAEAVCVYELYGGLVRDTGRKRGRGGDAEPKKNKKIKKNKITENREGEDGWPMRLQDIMRKLEGFALVT